MKKQRYGKIEKKILEILNDFKNHYSYVEISLRRLAEEINDKKYNSVRNAVDRLEEYDIIQTITVSVYGHSTHFFGNKKTSLNVFQLI